LVSERELLDAIRVLLLDEHVVAEAAGAAATAAFLQDPATHARAAAGRYFARIALAFCVKSAESWPFNLSRAREWTAFFWSWRQVELCIQRDRCDL
jgi:hypothetical protein